MPNPNAASLNRRSFLASLALGLVLIVLAVRLPLAWLDRAEQRAFVEPVAAVLSAIEEHFYREPNREALQRSAIDGMIGALNDPYTEFIPTIAMADFDREVRGEFVGIGAEIRTERGVLRIVSPLDDSPALNAGIQADDIVLAVDGKSIYNMPIDAIISELTGKPGTTVRLTIERDAEVGLPSDALEPSTPAARPELAEQGIAIEPPPAGQDRVRFDVEIVRERIRAETIRGLARDGESWDFFVDPVARIAYIRITQFTDTTAPRLREYCARLFVNGDARGLVLDLRFNAGGSLLAAIETADLFIREGTIVSTAGRTTPTEYAEAYAEGTLPDFPMIVLVNSESASASEVVAGALADNNRAIVLGERSFGKGLVQAIYRLPGSIGQIKITEQYYALPSGRIIQRRDDSTTWGVDPNPGFFVPMDDDENRLALQRRLQAEVLRAGNRDAEQDWSDPDWILEHLADPQLTAAVRAMRVKLETGEWDPPGEDQPDAVASLDALRAEERRFDALLRELERSERRLNALTSGLPEDAEPVAPLIPEDVELTDGTLELRDAEGNVITTLRITSDALARWLSDAPLEPFDESP